jgi:2-polyprenyl-3-methyl-5-hydroxy-6-metoxy-1,4-benzoquinol methylase
MQIYDKELSDVTRYIENHKHLTLQHYELEFASIMWRIRLFVPVDETSRILEIGTGTGWFPIMCKLKGFHCKGLEISPQLVEYGIDFGKRNGVTPDIELGNVEETDLGHSEYDVVLASSVFEHVEHWEQGIRSIYEALKPGGLLYFNSTNKFALVSQEYNMPFYGWLPDRVRYWLRERRQGEEIMRLGIDFNQFTYPVLRRCFKQAGFSTILDAVEMLDPDQMRNPTLCKKVLIKGLKKVTPLKHLALVFAPVTTFVCIK